MAVFYAVFCPTCRVAQPIEMLLVTSLRDHQRVKQSDRALGVMTICMKLCHKLFLTFDASTAGDMPFGLSKMALQRCRSMCDSVHWDCVRKQT